MCKRLQSCPDLQTTISAPTSGCSLLGTTYGHQALLLRASAGLDAADALRAAYCCSSGAAASSCLQPLAQWSPAHLACCSPVLAGPLHCSAVHWPQPELECLPACSSSSSSSDGVEEESKTSGPGFGSSTRSSPAKRDSQGRLIGVDTLIQVTLDWLH